MCFAHENEQTYVMPSGELDDETRAEIWDYLERLNNGCNGRSMKWEEFYAACMERMPDALKGEAYHVPEIARLVVSATHGYSIGNLPHYVYGENESQRKDNYRKTLKQFHRMLNERISAGWKAYLNKELFYALGNQWVVGGNADYVGTFPKRLSKMLFKTCGVKLSNQHIETIGNLGAKCLTTVDYTLSFDREFADCDEDEFNERYLNEGSCWRPGGEYEASREMLYEAGGYGLLAWENDKPVARCWIVEQNNKWLLFNAYGKLSLTQFARILAHKHGMTYRVCGLYNHGGKNNGIYINDGKGVVVCSNDDMSVLPEYPDFDFGWDVPNSDYCYECNCTIDLDESYISPDGEHICESCYCDNYISCERCGETFSQEDVNNCEGSYYCDSCTTREGYNRCNDCGEYRQNTLIAMGEKICEECLDNYCYCDCCEEYRDETTETDDGSACNSCISDHYTSCEHCDKWTQNNQYCDECELLKCECEDIENGCIECKTSPIPGQLTLEMPSC